MLTLSQLISIANRKKLETGLDYVVIATGKSCNCLDLMELKEYNNIPFNFRYTIEYSTKK